MDLNYALFELKQESICTTTYTNEKGYFIIYLLSITIILSCFESLDIAPILAAIFPQLIFDYDVSIQPSALFTYKLEMKHHSLLL